MSVEASTASERWSALEALADKGKESVFTGCDLAALDSFVAELARWNKAIRLVGPRDEEGIAAQVADALEPFLFMPPRFPLLDIGSGAGLPAVPLALLTGEEVLCVEPRQKRVTFLNHIARHLALPNLSTLCARVEEVAKTQPEKLGSFACVTARAVSDVETLLSWAHPYLAPEGRVVLGRGGEGAPEVEGWRLLSRIEYVGSATSSPRSVVAYTRED